MYYSKLVNENSFYKNKCFYSNLKMPEILQEKIISIPCYPYLKSNDQKYIFDKIENSFVK